MVTVMLWANQNYQSLAEQDRIVGANSQFHPTIHSPYSSRTPPHTQTVFLSLRESSTHQRVALVIFANRQGDENKQVHQTPASEREAVTKPKGAPAKSNRLN